MTCYTGYTLSNGNCILSTSAPPSNPLCAHFNTAGQCTQCQATAYFGPGGICTKANP